MTNQGEANTINNGLSGNSGPSGTLAVSSDIDPSQLWLQQSGNDLIVTVFGGATTDIAGWYSGSYQQLSYLKLVDGSEITNSQMSTLVSLMASYQSSNPAFNPTASGTTMPTDPTFQASLQHDWARTISGTAGNDVLGSDVGNTTINGNGGQDTYLLGQGYGEDYVSNGISGTNKPSGTLDLLAGLDPSKIWFSQSGTDLVVQVLGSNSEVYIKSWFNTSVPYRQLSSITLSDGSSISTGSITALTSAMTTYRTNNPNFSPHTATAMPTDPGVQAALQTDWARTITGTPGNETLGSQYGNNTLVGDGGSDAYQLGTGYGQSTIVNGLSSSNTAAGELDIIAPITSANVWIDRVDSTGAVSATGNNLRFVVMGSTSDMTVQNWFASGDSYAQLSEIKLTGSGLLLDSGLGNLLSAMSTFETNYAASHGGTAYNPMASGNGTITDQTVLSAVNADWHH